MKTRDLTYETLADWASRLSSCAALAYDTIEANNSKIPAPSQYFVGLFPRHKVLLNDIANKFRTPEQFELVTCKILFRCIIDDFINLLYMMQEDFSSDILERHCASAYKQRHDLLVKSVDVNTKFFNGTHPALFKISDKVREQKELETNELYKRFYKDWKAKHWKSFPPTTTIVTEELSSKSMVSIANAPALMRWKDFSTWVHYSIVTYEFDLEETDQNRERHFYREALSYSLKTLLIAWDALKKTADIGDFSDLTNVHKEILADSETIDVSDQMNRKF